MGGFPTRNEIGIHFSGKAQCDTSETSPLSELPRLLVRLDHVARFIKERESQRHCLVDRVSGTLRYENTTGQIWRD